MRNAIRSFLTSFRVGAAALAVVVLASASYTQTITTIDPPNSTFTIAQAINPVGQIVGYYLDGSGIHGFLRQPSGAITSFNVSRDGFQLGTFATAINPAGQITGYYDTFNLTQHSFLRRPDGTITLFFVNSTSTASAAPNPAPLVDVNLVDGDASSGINQAGQIAGVWGNARYFSFLRQRDGTIASFGCISGTGIPNTQAQAINSTGQITGWCYDGRGYSGFLRQPNGTIITFNPPGSNGTIATAINSTGQITGSYYDGNVTHGFLRQPSGSITTFDPAGSSNTQAKGINSTCQIASYYLGADSTYHGFLRQPDGSITTLDAPGAGTGSNQGTFAQAINPAGKITGYYIGRTTLTTALFAVNDTRAAIYFLPGGF
jgi:uncharacterized protein (UPF0297 family)